MENKLYAPRELLFPGSDLLQKPFVKRETVLSPNIYSCFQLARILVSKVSEIEAKKRKLILVADDEPLTFDLIDEFLKDADLSCNILPASTGQMAYDLAVSSTPDLIITDWLMPEVDGLELTRMLKEHPRTKDIPVIMITGALVQNEDFNKMLAAGAVDCVKKPFDEMELITRVKTALALHDALNEIKENEESIHTKNQFLHFLMDVAPNPVFYIDKTGSLLGCNERFGKMSGTSKNDVMEMNFYELIPGFTTHKNEISALASGAISQFDAEFVNSHSENRSLSLTCMGLGTRSGEAVVGSITDVTEIVQAGKSE